MGSFCAFIVLTRIVKRGKTPIMLISLSLSLHTVTNGQLQELSQTSESSSSASSYSSGTPFSSMNGLFMAPIPSSAAQSCMVDVGISAELPVQRHTLERAETAMQTDPLSDGASYSGSLVMETRRVVEPLKILKDTAIRTESLKESFRLKKHRPFASRETTDPSPKTALLLALSRPRQPIKRSQSYLTIYGRCHGSVILTILTMVDGNCNRIPGTAFQSPSPCPVSPQGAFHTH